MPDTSRADLALRFLAGTDWAGADIRPLAGDASNRRYDRLSMGGRSAVLMDAPPDKGEDTGPFLSVTRYLTGLGLSAPRILAADPDNGFLLIEDLGDALYARVVEATPELEVPIYRAAVDVLSDLHKAAPMPGLKPYDPEVMTPLAALAYDWYLSESLGADHAARDAFMPEMARVLKTRSICTVTILRDYHAENLLWLPEREGAARVGLLDFQDAMIGDPAYDLVSLLMDARRDVSPDLQDQMIGYYTQANGLDPATFLARYHAVGAQRNLRILGVFSRLSRRDGKRHYVDLIPRVWGHLMRNLDHPDLSGLARILRRDLPEPTPEILERLRR